MSTPEPPPSPRRRLAVRFAISLAIGVGLSWMLVRGGLPIVPERRAFGDLAPWAVPGYLATLVGVHWFRAVRWRHLLRPIGHVPLRSVVATSWIAYAALLFLPLRTGEVVRPLLVARRGTVRGWEAAGTVGAERIIDGVILSSTLFAALALTTPRRPFPDHVGGLPIPVAAVPGAAYTALILFLSVFAVMVLFYRHRQLALRLTRATLGVLSQRLAERAAAVVGRVADGMGFLPSTRHLGPFLAETGCYWALNAGGLWLLAQGCGLDAIGPGEAVVVLGCIGLGILVPSAPGYFGTFQLSIYLALAMFVTPELVTGAGSAYAFVVYTCQVVQHVALGSVGALLDRTDRRRRTAGGRPGLGASLPAAARGPSTEPREPRDSC